MKKLLFALAVFFLLNRSFGRADDAGVYTMGALGDSITTGFNAAPDKPMQNRFFNWATGNAPVSVYSHARKLRDAFGKKIHFINVAEAGALSTAIPLQTDRLASSAPAYVTLMIGANDMCSWPSNYQNNLARFLDPLRVSVKKLTAANPKVRILVVPIPDMCRLYELGTKNGCRPVWNALPLCTALLEVKVTPQVAFGFKQRVQLANQQLSFLQTEFPQNVLYAKKAENFSFNFDEVSQIDCFHPSVKEQKRIAEESWNEGWFRDIKLPLRG